ncbi:MAG: cbb3-type cytochrome c oxidase subunit I, partial [Alphaproteobacteria bacterium]|nr:cbb3-type cytochrome c oxidase subunit I [Alphaproteobacteria bacterium]
VPGHFHATVVAGTTLTFMGITYLVVPLIFRKEIMFPRLAQWQPYLFGVGVAGISVFMMGAGTLGVSRRHWDSYFSDAAMAFEYPPAAILLLSLNGLAGILAAVGGGLFCVIIVASVFFGKTREDSAAQTNPIIGIGGGEVASSYGSEGTLKLPGTMTLIAIFFIAFFLYYWVNWKYLSEVWPLN